MQDAQIITLYQNRDEAAIAETDAKYGRYCYSIAYSVLAEDGDSEECVNDTWLRTWNSIPPAVPKILKLFLAKITRNLSFDRYRKRTAEKRGGGELPLALSELSECIPGSVDVEAEVTARELGQVIQAFLETIPKRDGNIFLRRYFYVTDMKTLAADYGTSEQNVKLILSRTRQKLKTHLIKEGYTI